MRLGYPVISISIIVGTVAAVFSARPESSLAAMASAPATTMTAPSTTAPTVLPNARRSAPSVALPICCCCWGTTSGPSTGWCRCRCPLATSTSSSSSSCSSIFATVSFLAGPPLVTARWRRPADRTTGLTSRGRVVPSARRIRTAASAASTVTGGASANWTVDFTLGKAWGC